MLSNEKNILNFYICCAVIPLLREKKIYIKEGTKYEDET